MQQRNSNYHKASDAKVCGIWIPLAILFSFFVYGCSSGDSESQTENENDGSSNSEGTEAPSYELTQVVPQTITISIDPTSVSASTGLMNKNHTCEGSDTSPLLTWEGVPADSNSLVLILDDPASDTGGVVVGMEGEGLGLWTHWVVYSIPPSVTELAGGQPMADVLDNGSKHGTNGYGKAYYSGPCPQPTIMWSQSTNQRTPPIIAKSRPYYFKLYAIDQELGLVSGATRNEVLRAIDGHIIGAGELAVPFKSRKKEIRRGTECATCGK